MEKGIIVYVFVALACYIEVSNACDPGWAGFGDSCYKVFKSPVLTWQNARDHCKHLGNGAHLAIVMSNEENNFLLNMLRNTQFSDTNMQVWMDGNDLATEGTFIWEATGEGLEIADWGPNEPNQNGGNEDCLTFFGMYQFHWNDEHCDRKFPFVCERE
ncbi:hypothetical protein ACF0H5_020085 [Mactra antiquata]